MVLSEHSASTALNIDEKMEKGSYMTKGNKVNSEMTVGQQRWSHYNSSKKGKQHVNTEDEDDNFIEGDRFDEEFGDFRPNDGPNRAESITRPSSTTNSDVKNSKSRVSTVARPERTIRAGKAQSRSMKEMKKIQSFEEKSKSKTPSLHRCVEIQPTQFSLSNPSNIQDEEMSIFTESSLHTNMTLPVSNRNSISTIISYADGTTGAHSSRSSNNQARINQPSSFVSTTSTGAYSIGSQSDTRNLQRRNLSHISQPIIDHKGHAMSEDELKVMWKNAGKCTLCGLLTTHRKEKYGLFGVLRRMVPQTVEGESYKGYCLRCYDVPELREALKEPNIPLNLVRHDSLPHSPYSHDISGVASYPERKGSIITALFSSLKFQLCCGVTVFIIVGGIVAVGISMAKGPEPWVSPPPSVAPSLSPSTTSPTSSPTPWEWILSSQINSDVASFGYKVQLSYDGNILAVASPNFGNGKGRFDVYVLEELENEQKWWPMTTVSGVSNVGTQSKDSMGFGIQVSGDGRTIAVGSPGYKDGEGVVQLFNIDSNNQKLSTKGLPITGPLQGSEFGYSVALNYDGSRLFAGAPNYTLSDTEISGLVRAYEFDTNVNSWIRVGSDMIGPSNSRFGQSLDTGITGDVVLIGAPLSSDKYDEAGSIYFYKMDDNKVWYHYPSNNANGPMIGSKMGNVVSCSDDTLVAITSNSDNTMEKYPDAGVVQILGEGEGYVGSVGFPISGTHQNAGFGYDVDISGDGGVILASGQNSDKNAGSVTAFSIDFGKYLMIGKELTGPEIGTCQSFGNGPSVTIAARQLRFAVGYECVMSNGLSRAEVRVFDYFVLDDYVLPET